MIVGSIETPTFLNESNESMNKKGIIKDISYSTNVAVSVGAD